MELHRNFKFKLSPNKNQKQLFENHFFANNQAWNFALDYKIKELKQQSSIPKDQRCYTKFNDLYQLTIVHLKTRNIKFNSGVIQDQLRKLENTFRKYYSNKSQNGFPNFKSSKRNQQSIIIRNQSSTCDSNKFKVFKQHIKTKFHRDIPQNAKYTGGIIKRESDLNYYVILNLTIPHELPQQTNTTECGIDLNIKNISISDSSGASYQIQLDDFSKSKYTKRYNRIQKQLSKRYKKKNFSKKTKKLQNQLNQIQKKIKNKKEDRYHKISNDITNLHSRITIEDLKIDQMKSSDSTSLNRIISDISWNSLITKIKYKAEAKNVQIREINPAYSSQRCNKCGFIDKANRKTQSEFCCLRCNHKSNADLNASKNILQYDDWCLEQNAMWNNSTKSSQVLIGETDLARCGNTSTGSPGL